MQNAEYRNDLVDWVNEGTRWTHFITLTTRFEMPTKSLVREVERFIRRLEASTQGPVYNLWVIEVTAAGHHHVHMVAQLGEAMTAKHIASKWKVGGTKLNKHKLGWADIQPYKAQLRGVHYLTKTLPSDNVEWGFCLPKQVGYVSDAIPSA